MKTPIKAVAFDVFGTLVEITDKRNPYGRVLANLDLDDAERKMARRRLMSNPVGLAGIASVVSRAIDPRVLIEAEKDLYRELCSVRLFPETLAVLQRLRDEGFRIAVASNLALPYAIPVCTLLPTDLDAFAWSFDQGSLKPDADFYRTLCRKLECEPDEVLMVGDTWANDYQGAIAAGLQALHLDRSGQGVGNAISTLSELDLSTVRP